MENKKKDSDIIKALKRCMQLGCLKCEYNVKTKKSCIKNLMADTLDLIDRKNAELKEIKKLKLGQTQWKIICGDFFIEAECNNCGFLTLFNDKEEIKSHRYCPYCGAKINKKAVSK